MKFAYPPEASAAEYMFSVGLGMDGMKNLFTGNYVSGALEMAASVYIGLRRYMSVQKPVRGFSERQEENRTSIFSKFSKK